MASKYRKIDMRMWRDERFTKLSFEEKFVAVYCITAQSNRCGIFVLSPAMAAEELETLPQTFRERLANVCRALNWRWDSTNRVLYLPTWWKYNAPENANVLRGNMKDLDELPETPLLDEFYDNLTYLPETLHKTFREHYPKRSRNVPETFANPVTVTVTEAVTEAGTEAGTEEKKPAATSSLVVAKSTPLIPPEIDTERFRSAWNEWLTYRRSKRKTVSEQAAAKALAQLAAFGVEKAIASIEQSIRNDWQGLFEPKAGGKQKEGMFDSLKEFAKGGGE